MSAGSPEDLNDRSIKNRKMFKLLEKSWIFGWLLLVISNPTISYRIKHHIFQGSSFRRSSHVSYVRNVEPSTWQLNQSPLSSSQGNVQTVISPQEIASTVLQVEDDGYLSDIIFKNFQDIQFGETKKMGIIGTRELSKNHQQMVELLSYALVLSGNHVFTSGGGTSDSTNHAVIRGALRACNPDLLTVILPQSLSKQSEEMQTLLASVTNVIELPENDHLSLKEAANICNYQIFAIVDKILVFAYHNSYTILTSVKEFEKTIETIKFFLD